MLAFTHVEVNCSYFNLLVPVALVMQIKWCAIIWEDISQIKDSGNNSENLPTKVALGKNCKLGTVVFYRFRYAVADFCCISQLLVSGYIVNLGLLDFLLKCF